MNQFKTEKEYKKQFQTALDQAGQERTILTNYLEEQFRKLNTLIECLSQQTFWECFPEILGLDAKLSLFFELIMFEEFTNEEIIRLVENDYRCYFKELCGYDVKTKDKPSMIFNVL